MSKFDDDIHCSFCNKGRDEAKKLIAGQQDGTYICDNCVQLCLEVIQDDIKYKKQSQEYSELPTLRPYLTKSSGSSCFKSSIRFIFLAL